MATFSKILTNLLLSQCKTHPCLFKLHDRKGNLLVTIVVVYCDDCIIASNWTLQLLDQIKKVYAQKILDLEI
jgi:hypothetical protein